MDSLLESVRPSSAPSRSHRTIPARALGPCDGTAKRLPSASLLEAVLETGRGARSRNGELATGQRISGTGTAPPVKPQRRPGILPSPGSATCPPNGGKQPVVGERPSTRSTRAHRETASRRTVHASRRRKNRLRGDDHRWDPLHPAMDRPLPVVRGRGGAECDVGPPLRVRLPRGELRAPQCAARRSRTGRDRAGRWFSRTVSALEAAERSGSRPRSGRFGQLLRTAEPRALRLPWRFSLRLGGASRCRER